jgi:hypothetical protein
MMTLSTMTLSITTLSIMTLNIMTFSITIKRCNTQLNDTQNSYKVMLSVIDGERHKKASMLNVVKQNVIMLTVIMLRVVAPLNHLIRRRNNVIKT